MIPLPHLAHNAVRYDAHQHVVYAHTWAGDTLQFQTPAELHQAVAAHRCYATHAVVAAGIALCHAHGVAPHTLPRIDTSPLLLALCDTPVADFPAAFHAALQRMDRANERAARLAIQLCTNDDILVIADDDGLFAQLLIRMLTRAPHMPVVTATHIHHQPIIPPHATIALVVTPVDEHGAVATHITIPAIPHYVVAPTGPRQQPIAPPTTHFHAVVTARGVYRPDRVQQYYRDPDMGSDIIALG